MLWIIAAHQTAPTSLTLTFNDGEVLAVELSDVISGDHRAIIRELQHPVIFSDFKVEYDTVVWSNGVDFAPEFLRSLAERQNVVHA